MIVEKRMQLGGPLTGVKELDEGRIALLDARNAVRFLSLENFKLVSGFKTNIRQNTHLSQGADTSKDGRYVAFSVQKEGAVVYSSEKKRLLYHFKRHEGDVESIRINDRHGYLATGGQDGKTFVWSLETGRLIASLPHHADFVNTIAFSPNGLWVATGGYDRKIWVTNLSSLSKRMVLRGHGSAVTDLLFLSKRRLVSADKEGEIIVWNYFEGEIVKRLKKMVTGVTSLTVTPDGRFLFAADKSGAVALYDLESFEMLSLRYLSYAKPIRKILYVIQGNLLVVGLENGEVTFNSPLKEARLIDKLIDQKRYGEAFEVVESNPLLRYSKPYLRLEQIWNGSYEEAIGYLERGETQKAQEVLEPFNTDAQKRLLMQQLVHDYKEFAKFKSAVDNRKYPLAYSLANQYPMLKENRNFLKMEKEWERLFAKAKQLALQDGGEDKIQELLKPFRGISSKSVLIQTLVREKEIFKLFMRLVKAREYHKALELARRYPAIQELEEYKKIEKIAETIEQKAKTALEEGRFADAVRLAQQLQEFPEKKKTADMLISEANHYASALRLFAEKDYKAIFRMLEEFPYLEETDLMQKLENAWQKMVTQAERYAAKADVATLKKIFSSFMEIPQKRGRIVAIFKTAYMEMIERLFKKGDEAGLQRAIERYIELFGMDDELLSWLGLHGMRGQFPEPPEVDPQTINPAELPDTLV